MINPYQSIIEKLAPQYFARTLADISIDWSFIPVSKSSFEPEIIFVTLPAWAQDLGDENFQMPVPACCVIRADWQHVDWWQVAYLFLTCQFEASIENQHGPIHSYAARLPKHFNVLHKRAWANRIFILLRRMVCQRNNVLEQDVFQPLPRGKIYLTHDVDYIQKTLPLRIKQSVFAIFNMCRHILKGNLYHAFQAFKKFIIFAFKPANYWQFDTIQAMEQQYGLTSSWNIYAGERTNFKQWLLDPSYSLSNTPLIQKLNALSSLGHTVGLHQSFDAWACADLMQNERSQLQTHTALPISSCRQHWLRFSLKDTWLAQERAGFSLDTTLGFNEKPGFRGSYALKIPAWISKESRFSKTLAILPMILMDSQLFDYAQSSQFSRRQMIDNILEEVAFVGGEATIIWHQRVFHQDYQWGDDYAYLLEKVNALGLS